MKKNSKQGLMKFSSSLSGFKILVKKSYGYNKIFILIKWKNSILYLLGVIMCTSVEKFIYSKMYFLFFRKEDNLLLNEFIFHLFNYSIL